MVPLRTGGDDRWYSGTVDKVYANEKAKIKAEKAKEARQKKIADKIEALKASMEKEEETEADDQ